jgi:hypothetical protein
MLRVPETNFLQGITSISGRPLCGLFPGLTAKPKVTNREGHRSRHQRGFYKIPSSITLFWTTDVFFEQPIWVAQLNVVLWAKPFMVSAPTIWGPTASHRGVAAVTGHDRIDEVATALEQGFCGSRPHAFQERSERRRWHTFTLP